MLVDLIRVLHCHCHASVLTETERDRERRQRKRQKRRRKTRQDGRDEREEDIMMWTDAESKFAQEKAKVKSVWD